MQKILYLFPLAVLLCLAACSNNSADGNGKITSQIRDVKVFDKIKVSGKFNVLAATGKTQKVTVTADGNLIGDIETTVSDNILYIKTKNNVHLKASKTPVLTVRVKALKEIDTAGAVKLHVTNLMGDEFKVQTSGDSYVDLRGQVKKLKIETIGSASVNAIQLKANDVDVEISGSGHVKTHALNELDVKISGDGKIEYSGDPVINQEISGSGKILQIERK